jgi:hypothetical protein
MNNQFTQGPIVQGTTLGPIQPNQLITGGSFQPSSQACIVDLTPPVFSGIDFVTRGSLGQIRVSWLAASDISEPILYQVFVKPDTGFNLFQSSNIAGLTSQLSFDVFALGNGSLIQAGIEYHVGVRAIDAVGNQDANLISLTQTSPGIVGITAGKINGVFAVNEQNKLISSFWATDSEGVINNPARLGFASYFIFDENGNAVPGMFETNIQSDASGFFQITPIDSVLDLYNTYYTVSVTIEIDGVLVNYNLPITYPEAGPEYEPRAVFSINAANELQGTIWIVRDNQKMSSNLNFAKFEILNKAGQPVGISQDDIVSQNGLFQISPVVATQLVDFNHYTVEIEIEADGVIRKGVVGLVVNG